MKKNFLIILFFTLLSVLLSFISVHATDRHYWQNKQRELRYTPDGEDFVITNGDKRFTRAIYGTNTGFRFETSDFPNSDSICLIWEEVFTWPSKLLRGLLG